MGAGRPQEATENQDEQACLFSLLQPFGVPPAYRQSLAKSNKAQPQAASNTEMWSDYPTGQVIFKFNVFIFNCGKI